jgi:hypothetical protein
MLEAGEAECLVQIFISTDCAALAMAVVGVSETIFDPYSSYFLFAYIYSSMFRRTIPSIPSHTHLLSHAAQCIGLFRNRPKLWICECRVDILTRREAAGSVEKRRDSHFGILLFCAAPCAHAVLVSFLFPLIPPYPFLCSHSLTNAMSVVGIDFGSLHSKVRPRSSERSLRS